MLEKKDRKRQLWRILTALCIVVFVVSVGAALRTLWESKQEKSTFDQLAKLVQEEETVPSPAQTGEAAAEEEAEETAGWSRSMQGLQEENPDFAAWLRIPGTVIDYPVMHTPEDSQYYIRRDFYGNQSVSGTPFIGDNCDLDSLSFIIYAHNMKNDTMFGALDLYESRSYREEHPSLTLITPEGEREYEIVAAFRTQLPTARADGFRYYEYVGDLSEEQFDEFMAQLGRIAYYVMDEAVAYGDRLVMLSTCSYRARDERFVVVGREVQ